MALNLDYHLLETVDALLATLLRQLLLHVITRLTLKVASTILGLVRDIGRGPGLELIDACLSAGAAVDAGRSVVLSVVGGHSASITGVARIAGMGRLRDITSHVAKFLTVGRLLLVELAARLVAQVRGRKVRSVVPRVALGGMVDLAELIFRRRDAAGGRLSGLAGDIAKEDGGIAHCRQASVFRARESDKGVSCPTGQPER